MTIRVEVKGQVIEFPDGTPDDVIDAAVKRDFFGGGFEGAEASASGDRSSGPVSRGLKGLASSLNPIPAVKALISDPGGVAKGLVDTRQQFMDAGREFAMAMPGGRVEPSVMDPRSRMDHAVEGAYRSVAAIPVAGPIAHGITQDLSSSARSGDLAGAAGKAAGYAFGPKIMEAATRPIAALAPALKAGAESQYAKIFAKSADAQKVERVVPELIQRRVKLRDPRAELPAMAEANARQVLVERGPAGRFVPGAMKKTWNEAKQLGESAPESKTIATVAKEAAIAIAERAILALLPIPGAHHVAGLLSGGKAAQTLWQITRTPQFRTASAVEITRFADAIQSGRVHEAAAIGGQIMRGGAAIDAAQKQGLDAMMRLSSGTTGSW